MATGYTDFAGYTECVEMVNRDVRVVLGPHYGGRVLAYAWHGENALALDPDEDGVTYTPGKENPIGPSGGRFDIGPEMIIPPHPQLWLGAWEIAITGPWSAQMTSVKDEATGTQLVRDFHLDPQSSCLTSVQTIRNVSDHETQWCHWSRTFGRGHGICVVPLTESSRFPKRYVMYGPGAVMNFAPEDQAVVVRDDYLLVLDTPQQPKLGLDSYAGWFGYLMPHDVMLVKRFPTYPGRVYNEMAALTISLWYYQDMVCELEPIGPRQVLAPGESAAFTESWYLTPYAFPAKRADVDPVKVAAAAKALWAG